MSETFWFWTTVVAVFGITYLYLGVYIPWDEKRSKEKCKEDGWEPPNWGTQGEQ